MRRAFVLVLGLLGSCNFAGACLDGSGCDQNPSTGGNSGSCADYSLAENWKDASGATLSLSDTCTLTGSQCSFSGTVSQVDEDASPGTFQLTVSSVSSSGTNCPSAKTYSCQYLVSVPSGSILKTLELSCEGPTTLDNDIAGTFTQN